MTKPKTKSIPTRIRNWLRKVSPTLATTEGRVPARHRLSKESESCAFLEAYVKSTLLASYIKLLYRHQQLHTMLLLDQETALLMSFFSSQRHVVIGFIRAVQRLFRRSKLARRLVKTSYERMAS
jgi:hypothetical protein